MKQIAFERGLFKPPSADGKYKMNGKKFDEDDANQDPSYSLPHVLSHCWDFANARTCLLYTSPSPRDKRQSRMPSSA